MKTKTKKSVEKTIDLELMYQTISNLTNVVTQLEHDVKKVKTRLGI